VAVEKRQLLRPMRGIVGGVEIDGDQPGAMVQPLRMTFDHTLGQRRAHVIKLAQANRVLEARQRRLRGHIETRTSANIEERGRHCEISSAKDIYAIKNVLDSAKPSSRSFSDRAVRVKLIEASDTGDKLLALVENDGVVRFATGKEGMISARSMETLKKVIDPQCSK
jgi:hypothetical protein